MNFIKNYWKKIIGEGNESRPEPVHFCVEQSSKFTGQKNGNFLYWKIGGVKITRDLLDTKKKGKRKEKNKIIVIRF